MSLVPWRGLIHCRRVTGLIPWRCGSYGAEIVLLLNLKDAVGQGLDNLPVHALVAHACTRYDLVYLLVDGLDTLGVDFIDLIILLTKENVRLDVLMVFVSYDLAAAVREQQITNRRIPILARLERLLAIAYLFVTHFSCAKCLSILDSCGFSDRN